MMAPPNRGSISSTHIHDTPAPVEEPSTASIAGLVRGRGTYYPANQPMRWEG
jgi:hypothetical protein